MIAPLSEEQLEDLMHRLGTYYTRHAQVSDFGRTAFADLRSLIREVHSLRDVLRQQKGVFGVVKADLAALTTRPHDGSLRGIVTALQSELAELRRDARAGGRR